jgi:hypothetical protein
MILDFRTKVPITRKERAILYTILQMLDKRLRSLDATVIPRHAGSIRTPAPQRQYCPYLRGVSYELYCMHLCPATECGVHSLGRTGETASLPQLYGTSRHELRLGGALLGSLR